MADVIARLPIELAQELLDRDLVEPIIGSRADPESLSVVVELVGFGANLTTVVISSLLLPRAVADLVDWLGHRTASQDPGVDLHIRVGSDIQISANGDNELAATILNAVAQQVMRSEK